MWRCGGNWGSEGDRQVRRADRHEEGTRQVEREGMVVVVVVAGWGV